MNEYLRRPIVGLTYSSADMETFLLWRYMFQGVVAAGATPVSIDCAGDQQTIDRLVCRMDGLIISGGGDVDASLYGGDPDDPILQGVNRARDASEKAALLVALDRRLPVLAICRGLQFVNVTLGGTLYADLVRDRPDSGVHQESEDALARPSHDVTVTPGSLLAKWMGSDGTIAVNSEHHQGIRDLAAGLTPVAHAPDGLVEAAEILEQRLVGVQWHPEILWPHEPTSAALLRGFVSECQESASEFAARAK